MRNRPYRRLPWWLKTVSPAHIQHPSFLFSTLLQNRCFSAPDKLGISSGFDIVLHHLSIVFQNHPPVPCVYRHVGRRLIRVHKPTHFVGESRVRVYHPMASRGTTSTGPYEIGRAMQSGVRVASHTPVMQARRNTVQWFSAYHASGLVTLPAQFADFP